MTYTLYIGHRSYFSWSLSASLLFERFAMAHLVNTVILRPETENGVGPLMTDLAPARTLPTMITPEGAVLNDSLAICEELASRHPDAGFWPDTPLARGTARALAAEMHSSFGALRGAWPFNLRHAFQPVTPDAAVTAELDRLEQLWTHARAVTTPDGPWLCGDYSIVDAIFAPMAVRLANYGFDTRPTTKAYVAAHLADPALRRIRSKGIAAGPALSAFEHDSPQRPWPGPAPTPAHAIEGGTAENDACPYSGDPVTHLMETNGRVFGFCNAFCRDKTVTDPAAWPQFMALL
ncbi:glutathione S-transferase [Loktanella agnita]|uniref:glutathione S-transferase n=1 Tax=Loktanella agnita TaxID=287097 RepID=UPI00398634D9